MPHAIATPHSSADAAGLLLIQKAVGMEKYRKGSCCFQFFPLTCFCLKPLWKQAPGGVALLMVQKGWGGGCRGSTVVWAMWGRFGAEQT